MMLRICLFFFNLAVKTTKKSTNILLIDKLQILVLESINIPKPKAPILFQVFMKKFMIELICYHIHL